MTSVMGLLEEREAVARVRAEGLRAEAERIAAELVVAEAVLERRLIARAELAEALAAAAEAADAPFDDPREAAVTEVEAVPVAGSIVPRWHRGVTVQALAADYRRIVALVEGEPDGEGVSAKELADRLGLEVVPAKIEGVRSKARRLVERGWLSASPSGRFTPRQSMQNDPASPGNGGRGGGS
ncbi:hypothetical protein [Streptomyces sioyaensis]|uniref:hypothetical protein n=1 Tax=Streptomyces sioyaensis TaxID=67364 RepID=UPI0036E5D19F